MISGPGYLCWIERLPDGWYVCETGAGYTECHGPFRWRWVAQLLKWLIEE